MIDVRDGGDIDSSNRGERGREGGEEGGRGVAGEAVEQVREMEVEGASNRGSEKRD